MALKYDGPCPAHPRINWDCKHCKAYWTRTARQPLADRHSVPIYRELHWAAQTSTEIT